VRRLTAHIVENARFIEENVERGAAGNTEPGISREERAARVEGIAAGSPADAVATLDQYAGDLDALFERLSADELERICYHPAGNRSARWYAQQRVAEVAFHRSDFLRSLGQEGALDEAVAAFLLPMLLESNLPRTYQRGPKGQGRYRLAAEGRPDLSWLLVATPEALAAQRGGAESADVTITAPAGVLALLIYGRADLAEQERAGRARVEGDRAAAERFHTLFPGP
jgi:uncharacterized protein (TIGR03083 family)